VDNVLRKAVEEFGVLL